MFKAKSRPKNHRKPDTSTGDEGTTLRPDDATSPTGQSNPQMSLEDMVALQKLRRTRQGIDASKLAMGEPKKKDIEEDDGKGSTQPAYGLQKPRESDVDPKADQSTKARRAVRNNNFTQQTNALDVDKHMMTYIEENLKLLREQQQGAGSSRESGADDHTGGGKEGGAGDMVKFGDKYKTTNKELKEGSVTASLAMLSAIPEVDLGMDARLRNIQETEKAKRAAVEEQLSLHSGAAAGGAQAQGQGNQSNGDEARLAAARFYNPNLRQLSDETLLKQAKLQALGLPVPEPSQKRHRGDRPEVATDEMAVERFKKRMKRW